MSFLKQEEEARKRKELEEIMAENNKKIEEAQRKLVSIIILEKSIDHRFISLYENFYSVMPSPHIPKILS